MRTRRTWRLSMLARRGLSLGAAGILACAPENDAEQGVAGAQGAFDTTAMVELRLPQGDEFFLVVDGAVNRTGVLVAEFNSGNLFLFERTGGFRKRLGGKGEGPGQFSRISRVQSQADGFLVADQALKRVTRLAGDGSLEGIEVLPPGPNGMSLGPIGALANGLVLASTRPRVPKTATTVPRVQADSVPLVVADPKTGKVAVIGHFIGSESLVSPREGGGTTVWPAIFGKSSGVAIADSSIIVFDPTRDVALKFQAGGGRPVEYKTDEAGQPLLEHSVKATLERLRVEAPGRKEFDQLVDITPIPERLPKYGWVGFVRTPVLTVSDNGELWLLRFGGIDDMIPRYDVFTIAGHYLGVRDGVARTRLLAIGDGVALLRRTDEDGSEGLFLVPVISSDR